MIQIYTLYRDYPVDATFRVHMATFDVDGKDKTYNKVNYENSAKLRMAQQGLLRNFGVKKVLTKNNEFQ